MQYKYNTYRQIHNNTISNATLLVVVPFKQMSIDESVFWRSLLPLIPVELIVKVVPSLRDDISIYLSYPIYSQRIQPTNKQVAEFTPVKEKVMWYIYIQRRLSADLSRQTIGALTPVFKQLALTDEVMLYIEQELGGGCPRAALNFLFRRCLNPYVMDDDQIKELRTKCNQTRAAAAGIDNSTDRLHPTPQHM